MADELFGECFLDYKDMDDVQLAATLQRLPPGEYEKPTRSGKLEPLIFRKVAPVFTWLDLVEDPRGLRSIYGADNPPSLEKILLHEVVLKCDGPSVVLRFDLPEFPTSAPIKWRDRGFSVVQIGLTMIGVKDLSLTGWNHHGWASMELASRDDLVMLEVLWGSARVQVQADAAAVTSISAYAGDLSLK
ncbi:Imm50 family immunity protein [Micromonospora sp. NPDC048898]|uniref:Imm50 family immunity protein n=1 Tax=Micromonospora sp. NPDC048898 TaxID=3364260 RepID=UPI0037188919